MVSGVGVKDPRITTGCETLELACEDMWKPRYHVITRIVKVKVEAVQLFWSRSIVEEKYHIRVGVLRQKIICKFNEFSRLIN